MKTKVEIKGIEFDGELEAIENTLMVCLYSEEDSEASIWIEAKENKLQIRTNTEKTAESFLYVKHGLRHGIDYYYEIDWLSNFYYQSIIHIMDEKDREVLRKQLKNRT